MDKPDAPLNLARIAFRLALAVALLILMNFVGIVAIIVTNVVVLDQSEQNQRHVDCIVASVSEHPPAYCVPVIESLRENGVLRPTTTTTEPTP